MSVRPGHCLAWLVACLACGCATVAPARYVFDTPDQLLAGATEWAIWRGTLERNAQQQAQIAACVRDAAACDGRLKSLRPVLVRGAALATEDKVRLANRYINRRHYRNDRNWTTDASISDLQRNEWRSLLEFLERGGDCEDYATAKYFLLRELGVPAEDLRVVIAWDRKFRAYHALLAYRAEPTAWLLDSDDSIKRGPQHRDFRFLFSLNETGIWDHSIEAPESPLDERV